MNKITIPKIPMKNDQTKLRIIDVSMAVLLFQNLYYIE